VTALFDPAPALDLMRRRALELDIGFHRHAKQTLGEHIDRQVSRWMTGARMTAATADRVALSLGVHPIELWGDDWLTEEAPV